MDPIDRFCESFGNFDPTRPFLVAEVYGEDAVFEDPAHRVEGRKALAAYFARLDRNLRSAQFTFHEVLRGDAVASLSWTMELQLKVGPKKPIVVVGASWLRHDDRFVVHQRDHFDLGALVYEHVPVLGWVVRAIRRSM